MNPYITPSDKRDPEVRRTINKQTREARKVVSALFNRYRKQDELVRMESVLNTVGIMSAELVRLGADVDPKIGETFADLLRFHIDHAFSQDEGGQFQ